MWGECVCIVCVAFATVDIDSIFFFCSSHVNHLIELCGTCTIDPDEDSGFTGFTELIDIDHVQDPATPHSLSRQTSLLQGFGIIAHGCLDVYLVLIYTGDWLLSASCRREALHRMTSLP